MNIEKTIKHAVKEAVSCLYGSSPDIAEIQIQKTRKEIIGDYTIVVFPFLRISKKPPEETAKDIGDHLVKNEKNITKYNVIKGFLNIQININYWKEFINSIAEKKTFAFKSIEEKNVCSMIEFSSPNTNKPLHLGHIRNNLLGFSISKILEANGKYVVKVNLVNDRGIHICKTMLAWQKWGEEKTPDKHGVKGDKLVGELYVKFETEYRKQIEELIEGGISRKDAEMEATLILEARELLRKWETKDPQTVELWRTMNSWVYEGFDLTYKRLGVNFDRIYYESDTYMLGKDIVINGLNKGIFYQKDDKSVWVDLTDEGLDHKLLLRADGTSVYMTQDIGTAIERIKDFDVDKLIYVVGNEQEYHFNVLSLILLKLGYAWGKNLYHLSYGMVELPEGKMKSREGKVVDADDLIEEMIKTAAETSQELGKLEDFSTTETYEVNRIIAMGALKYFMLKVDPRKNMLFNPAESIDFNGNTGPFIQYTCVRIKSVVRKAEIMNIKQLTELASETIINNKEIELIKILHDLPAVINEAGNNLSPALIANYCYELAREYNQYYHDYPILKETDMCIRDFRLLLSRIIMNTISSALILLGIEVPERM